MRETRATALVCVLRVSSHPGLCTTMTTAIDERQPLLPPVVTDGDLIEDGPEAAAAPETETEPKKPRSWKEVFWYTLLGVLGVFFSVLFIKRFIDADDVNVRISRTRIFIRLIPTRRSSTLARR